MVDVITSVLNQKDHSNVVVGVGSTWRVMEGLALILMNARLVLTTVNRDVSTLMAHSNVVVGVVSTWGVMEGLALILMNARPVLTTVNRDVSTLRAHLHVAVIVD